MLFPLDSIPLTRFRISVKHYRSTHDIIAEILNATKDKTLTKTHVMFAAYLVTQQTSEYITELVMKDLLTQYKKTFKASEQGLEYLRLYEAMRKL